MTGNAPVVLFAYNRADHLKQTVEALSLCQRAKDTDIYVYSDGPKPGADHSVAAVRAYLDQYHWKDAFRSVTVDTSEQNRGLAVSIKSGVDSVLSRHARVIVVEDDLVVSPDFLDFLNDCLDFYEDDQAVGSVTANNPLLKSIMNYPHDVIAIRRNCSCGWAIWRDRWQAIDWSELTMDQLKDENVKERFCAAGADRVARLQRTETGAGDSWSVRFGLWQAMTQRHTIYPRDNRVSNIGMDGSGTNSGAFEKLNEELKPGPYQLSSLEPDRDIERLFAEQNHPSFFRRLIRKSMREMSRMIPKAR